MKDDIIYYPSDCQIQITVTDEETELPVDLTVFDIDIIVKLYQKGGVSVQDYKKSESQIDLTSAVSGILIVQLDRDNSDNCINGILLAEIQLQKSDVNCQDDINKRSIGEIEIAIMRKSSL